MARIVLQIDVDDKGNPVVKKLGKNLEATTKKASKLGNVLKSAAASIALWKAISALQETVAFAGKELLDFNKILKQTQAITGTSPAQIETLKDLILDLGNATEFTASEIAGASLQVTKMGVAVEDQLALLPAVLNLATSSVVDLEKAVDVAARTAKSFQIDLKDLDQVANIIQTTVSSTAIGLDDFADSMKFIAPIAKTTGVSIQQVSALIGKLGDIGIKGTLAGTSLKNIITNLLKPSKEVAVALRSMNLHGKSLADILKGLRDRGLGVKEFLEGFNLRALAGALAVSDLSEAVNDLNKNIDEQKNKVEEIGKIIRTSWIDQMLELRNVIVNTAIEFSRAFETVSTDGSFKNLKQFFVDLQMLMRENRDQIREFVQKGLDIAIASFSWIIDNRAAILAVFKFLIAKKLLTAITAIGGALVMAGKGFLTFLTASSALTKVPRGVGQVTSALSSMNIVLAASAVAWTFIADEAERLAENAERAARAGGAITVKGTDIKIQALEELKPFIQELENISRNFAQIDQSRVQRPRISPLSGVQTTDFGKNVDSQIAKMFDQAEKALKAKQLEITKKTGLGETFFEINSTVKGLDFSLKNLRIQSEKLVEAQEKVEEVIRPPVITPPGTGFDPGPEEIKNLKDQVNELGRAWFERMGKELNRFGLPESVLDNITSAIVPTAQFSADKLKGLFGNFDSVLRESTINMRAFAKSAIDLTGRNQVQLNEAIRDSEEAMSGFGTEILSAKFGITAFNDEINALDLNALLQQPRIRQGLGGGFGPATNLGGGIKLESATEALKEDTLNLKGFQLEMESFLLTSEKNLTKYKEDIKAAKLETINSLLGTTEAFTSAIGNLMSVRRQTEIQAIDDSLTALEEEKQQRLKIAGDDARGRLAIESRFIKRQQQLEEQRASKMKEQKRKEKQIAITSSIINTALGITSALTAPWPKNLIDSITVGTLGALQIATIEAQKFSSGGLVRGPGTGISDSVPALLSAGEFVVPARTVASVGGTEGVQDRLSDDVDFMADLVGNRGSVVIKIDNFIGERDYERGLFERLEKERPRWLSGV